LVAIALLGMALVGCVTTTATGAPAKVRITSNPEAVHGCKFLGNVRGDDHLNGGQFGQAAAEESATKEMRNKTNAVGRNVILMVRSTTNTGGSSQLGEAYAGPVAPEQAR
jgi:hypothetical protein